MGTQSGIYILKDGITRHIIHEDYNNLSLSDDAIYAIFKDKEDGIWVGSYFGGVDPQAILFLSEFLSYYLQKFNQWI